MTIRDAYIGIIAHNEMWARDEWDIGMVITMVDGVVSCARINSMNKNIISSIPYLPSNRDITAKDWRKIA